MRGSTVLTPAIYVDESALQTTVKMEDPLYHGIEKDHGFLTLNPMLAYVELMLDDLGPINSILRSPAAAKPSTDLAGSTRKPTDLAHQTVNTPEEIRDANFRCLVSVFKWMRDEKGVKKILKLVVVDNQGWQFSDDQIQQALKEWDVRYLDWNKRDLSLDAIGKGGESKLKELWLTWGGQNTVLLGWSDVEYGLQKQLPEV